MFVSEMLVEPLRISNQGLARRVPHSISVTERIVNAYGRWKPPSAGGGTTLTRCTGRLRAQFQPFTNLSQGLSRMPNQKQLRIPHTSSKRSRLPQFWTLK
jgi:hypothetical protein